MPFEMQDIPQELIDHFIGFIQDDQKALCSSRLVNRSWKIAASEHLFRSLDLSIYKFPDSHSVGSCHGQPKTLQGPGRFEALLAILRASDDIARCVREVKIGRTSHFHYASVDNFKKQDYYAQLISSVLSHLRHISLVILLEMNWSHLSPVFLSCILNLCRSSNLDTIEIWNCQMPSVSSVMDFLNASRDVRSLRLSYMRINNVPPVEENEHGSHKLRDTVMEKPRLCTASLYSLAIDSFPDAPILHKIFSTQSFVFDFSELRRLHLSNINDVNVLTEVLRKIGRSLEILDLRLLPGITKLPFPELPAVGLDLSHCTRLQQLCISGFYWTPFFCPAKFLAHLFGKKFDPSYPLEHLRVNVSVNKPLHPQDDNLSKFNSNHTDTHSRPKDLDYSVWRTLDTALSLPAFTKLERFQIKLVTMRDGIVDTSRLFEMFPKLTSRGVQVTCS